MNTDCEGKVTNFWAFIAIFSSKNLQKRMLSPSLAIPHAPKLPMPSCLVLLRQKHNNSQFFLQNHCFCSIYYYFCNRRSEEGLHRGLSISAVFMLIIYIRVSQLMPKERNKADSYREKAYEGDTKAMNNLGVCYERGTGVKVNHQLAFEWYMKAAELGDVYGCFNVGECYFHGKGVEQSAEKAFEWYMKAADKGDMQSQVNVANAYYLGEGVEKDHHKAFLWYREAAFQGHVLSQKNCGAAFWNGDGVERDLAECAFWFELAANGGDAQAQFAIGWFHMTGNGVPVDEKKGLKWIHKATFQGYQPAIDYCKEHGYKWY